MKTNSERVAEDMRVLIDDAGELLRANASQLSEQAIAARTELSAALDTARAVCDGLEEQIKSKAKAADRALRDHPYQTIGIALGVGLGAGLILARK